MPIDDDNVTRLNGMTFCPHIPSTIAPVNICPCEQVHMILNLAIFQNIVLQPSKLRNRHTFISPESFGMFEIGRTACEFSPGPNKGALPPLRSRLIGGKIDVVFWPVAKHSLNIFGSFVLRKLGLRHNTFGNIYFVHA